MTASALVAADAALERGEVPTVPHEGSPVLWAVVWHEALPPSWAHEPWCVRVVATTRGGLMSPGTMPVGRHVSCERARHEALDDLNWCRRTERFGALAPREVEDTDAPVSGGGR